MGDGAVGQLVGLGVKISLIAASPAAVFPFAFDVFDNTSNFQLAWRKDLT